MRRKNLLTYSLISAGLAEVLLLAGYLWMSIQFSFSPSFKPEMLWPIALVGLIGACVGALVSLVRNNPIPE